MCVQKDAAQTKIDALIAALHALTQQVARMGEKLDAMAANSGQPKP